VEPPESGGFLIVLDTTEEQGLEVNDHLREIHENG